MKKMWSLGLLVILIMLFALPALAEPWKVFHGNAVIHKGQVVEGDLYFQGDYLEIEGDIHGDVIAMAREVKASGKIEGNLLGIVWERMTVSGLVQGDMRVLTRHLAFSGTVGETLSTAALQAELGPGSVVNKGILGLFHEVKSTGLIHGPVRLSGYALTRIGGEIDGNLQIHGAPVEWLKNAKITGNVDDYSGITDTFRASRVKVTGEYRIHPGNQLMKKFMKTLLLFSLIWFLGSILIGLIFYRLFPRTSWRISEPGRVHFRKYLLTGLVSFIGIPILVVILIMTRVGIPLAVLLGLFYILLLLFSNVPLYLWTGRLVFAKSRLDARRHPVLLVILGGVVLAVLSTIPFVSYFLQIIGLGMVVGNIRIETDENSEREVRA